MIWLEIKGNIRLAWQQEKDLNDPVHLEHEARCDWRPLAIVLVLCGLGTLVGLVKIAAVHFKLYPHHWPF